MPPCRAVLIGLLISPACTFEDPNAPPDPDPCVQEPPSANDFQAYWARIDGPASCADPTKADTVTHFTGAGWNELSAFCRARNLFLGAIEVGNSPDVQTPTSLVAPLKIERNLPIPADAFGYCIVNKGTVSEQVSYSVCGIPEAGKRACEETLPKQASIEVTAEWVPCPGGALCPKQDPALAGDACAGIGDPDALHSFAMWVDVPQYVCAEAPEGDAGVALTVDDQKDSLFVSLGAGFNRQSALCMAAGVHDSAGNLQYGVEMPVRDEPAPRDDNGKRTGFPMLTKISPAGAKGYCLYGDDKGVLQFALFNFCATVIDADPDALAPKAVCEEGLTGVGGLRKGEWSACPGGDLCVD